MTETRPRELTPEERAILDRFAAAPAQSAPLRIPPGMDVAVEFLDPLASNAETSTTAPSAGPGDPPPSSGTT